MSAKAILVICAQALVVKSALSQFIASGLAAPYGLNDGLAAPFSGWAGRGLAYDGYPTLAPAMDFTPTSCGAFTVTSASAIPPSGISVISENVYEGVLAVAGEMPFVGTVGMEGVLPTAGVGAINHACGNRINAIVSETTAFAPVYADAFVAPAAAIAPFGAAIAPGFAGAGFAPGFTVAAFGGWADRGWGYAL